MSFSGWLVAIAIFVTILIIALGIGWWIRNNITPLPPPPNPFSEPVVWGTPTKGPNPTKNFCQLYQFPTAIANINGFETAIPGAPTFNPNTLNNLQGSNIIPSCIDTDQTVAQQVQHTCSAPFGVIDGAITRCFLLTGGVTGLGGSESYYTNTGCTKVPACAGQVSLVSVNFQAPRPTQPGQLPDIFCIQNSNSNALMEICNPSLQSQLFRVTRINPGQNPNTLQPGMGQNGLIAQILDRSNNLCLQPGNMTTTTIFDPSYVGCTGPTSTFSGMSVGFSACTGGSSPGYIWALLPSIAFCSNPQGCPGCTGCFGCVRTPGTINCSGCAGCTGFSPIVTPPQIIYIGNLNLNNIPSGATGYKGLTGPSAIFQWLIDNNAQSLYFGGTGTGLILRNIGVDVNICPNKGYISQYLNLATYNTISQESVCLAQGTLNCTPL